VHLERVSLRNYRAFKDAEITLPTAGVVLLVGPNNTGKTALLSVLEILADPGYKQAHRHAGSSEPVDISARFVLSEEDRLELFRTLGGDMESWPASDALRWIEWNYTEPTPGLLVARIITLQGDGEPAEVARVQWDTGQATGSIFMLRFLDWFRENPPSAPFRLDNVSSGGIGAVFADLTHSYLNPLKPLMDRWRGSYYHFRALRSGTERSRQVRASSRLNPTGDNLSEALLYLNTQQSPAFGRSKAPQPAHS